MSQAPEKAVTWSNSTNQAFPASPSEGAVIFLSWGGDSSHAIAEALHRILGVHFPLADVFFSPVSIDIGDDPMAAMFENHLLQAQALVAVLTEDSATRPWVIWEIATVWARQKLVAALFVDVTPGNVPGPLPLKVQGAQITDRARVDDALRKIAEATGANESQPLADDEWEELMAAVAGAPHAAPPVPPPSADVVIKRGDFSYNRGDGLVTNDVTADLEDITATGNDGTGAVFNGPVRATGLRAGYNGLGGVYIGPGRPPPSPTLAKEGTSGRSHVDDVGRNDPCPCGSGKKLKFCHP